MLKLFDFDVKITTTRGSVIITTIELLDKLICDAIILLIAFLKNMSYYGKNLMDQFFIFSYFLYSAIICIIALCNRLTHVISFIIALSHSNQFYPIFGKNGS